MRIFFAAQSTPNEKALPQSRLWLVNLYQPLLDLGHEVIRFTHDWIPRAYEWDPRCRRDQERIRQNRPRFSEGLVQAVRALHRVRPLDLFFSYFSSAHVEPSAIRAIRALGIPTVNWYCNGSYQLHLVADIAPAYDFCLVPEKIRLADYRRLGANPLYCQAAANPNIYRPCPVPVEYDVTFVGQRYGNRPGLVHRLLAAGVDVRVWGPGWQDRRGWREWAIRQAVNVKRRLLRRECLPPERIPRERCGPPLSDAELIAMYSRSKIALGFSSVAQLPAYGQPPIKQVRLRDFEAPMSGAFYLVEHFEELAEFFEPDKEIVCFTDAADLVDKARFYLAHDAERDRIRRAGLRRARLEHTWQRRFQTVFQQMGLGKRNGTRAA